MLRRTQRTRRVQHKKWLRYHLKRQHGRCHYCSAPLVVGHFRFRPTLDHVVALSRGGADHFENTVAACYECNRKKSNRDYDEFCANGAASTALTNI